MDISELFQTTLIPSMKKEEPQKPAAKKTGEKKGAKKGAQPARYRLPVTLHSNYTEPVVIGGEGFPEEMTESEILKEARERHGCFKNFTAEALDEKTMLLVPQAYNCVKKGILKITDELEVRFGDDAMDISPIAEGIKEIPYEKLARYASEQAGTGIDLLHEGSTVTLLYSMDGSGSIENLKFPVTAVLGANTSITVQEDEFREFVSGMNRKGESAADNEDGGDEDEDPENDATPEETAATAKGLLTADNFLRFVESKEPTYKGGHGQLYINEKLNFVRALYKKKFTALNKAEKKETLYPSDATLSLIYEKIQLTPEMFGGRKEVTERDIQRYLEKDRPEYSKERTKIEYDEKHKLIIATIMGGKRGAVEYSEENGTRYRTSDTPFMHITAATDGSGRGRMVWKMPKIPYRMLRSMCHFFGKVYRTYGTESLVSIMWDPDKDGYSLYVPEQTVLPGSVDYRNDGNIQKRMWTLGTFHSHGIFSPYFSHTDDENEKADGIYGVAGNFDRPDPLIKMRAGTGGNLIARLARFLSGYTGDMAIKAAIADGDTVEYKNVDRQPFDSEDAGENKAVVLAENIESCFHVRLDSYPEYILKTEDIDRIFHSLNKEGSLVSSSSSDINILVSCVDNHAARKVCHDWFGKVYFPGTTFFIDPANEDVSGEVVIAKRNAHTITSPNRFWYYPDIINDPGRPVNEMSCEELNNAAPQHFATNCYAADICFAFIAGIIMCQENARLILGGITYFHAFKMFQRFYACEYDEEEERYVREA